MIKVTVFYPVKENDWFDLPYYLNNHMPLSKSIFGAVLKGIAIEENTAAASDEVISYKIIGHLFFEKIEDFYDRFLPNENVLREDGLKYTNVTPILQISEVLLWQTPWVN